MHLVAHVHVWIDCLAALDAFAAADEMITSCVHLANEKKLRFIVKNSETKTLMVIE